MMLKTIAQTYILVCLVFSVGHFTVMEVILKKQ